MTIFIASMIGTAIIFLLDLLTGADIRLHVLYVFPISLIALYCVRRRFIIAALVTTVALQTITFAVQALSISSFIADLIVATLASLLTVYLARKARVNHMIAMNHAMTDALTNIANRRAFLLALDAEIARQKRYGSVASLAILDLDGFKALNDSKGHLTGDEALKLVAAVLSSNTRNTDVAARIGGDEFAVLMPNTGDMDSDFLCRKLCRAIAERMIAAGFSVTTSIGCKTFWQAPNSISDALQQADELMYHAKKSGKNRVQSNRPIVVARHDGNRSFITKL